MLGHKIYLDVEGESKPLNNKQKQSSLENSIQILPTIHKRENIHPE